MHHNRKSAAKLNDYHASFHLTGQFATLCAVVAFFITSASSQSGEYEPGESPVVWGDTTRNNMVDLADLVKLGAHWNESSTRFGWKNTAVREHLEKRWLQEVPAPVAEIGWDNRPATTTIPDFTNKAAKLIGPGYAKQILESPELPIGVGFGLSFGKDGLPPTIMLPVFSTPEGLKPVRAQFRDLEGGYSDSRAFYDFPVDQLDEQFQYVRSYEEEQEFRGVDLSVEARYSIFNVGLTHSDKREKYREGRSHKLLFKATKSYGWVFLPPEDRKLAPDFLKALEDENLNAYGTHYVYAEHRIGTLYIELDFTTSKERDRNATKSTAQFGLTAGMFKTNIKGAIEKIKENVKDVTSVRVQVTKRGGSSDITLSDGRSWLAVVNSLSADSENLQDDVDKLIGAWSADLTFGNATVDNFYCRPLTDFFDTTPVLPWNKGKNLRDWYKRYAELSDVSTDLHGILNPSGTDFTFNFRHYGSAGPANNNPVPEGKATWLEYMNAKRSELKELRDELLVIGREIYDASETDSVTFDPADPQYQIPDLLFPRYQPIFIKEMTEQLGPCGAYPSMFVRLKGRIQGTDFTEEGNYQWQAIKVRDPFQCDNTPQFGDPIETTLHFDEPGLTEFWFQTRFNSANSNCCQQLGDWIGAGAENFAIAIVDIAANPDRIIGYGCGTNFCDRVPLDLFSVDDWPAFID